MSEANRIKLLKKTLVLVGVLFIFGIYSLAILGPTGWKRRTEQSQYPAMIPARDGTF